MGLGLFWFPLPYVQPVTKYKEDNVLYINVLDIKIMAEDDCDFDTLAALLDNDDEEMEATSRCTFEENDDELDALAQLEEEEERSSQRLPPQPPQEVDDELKNLYAKIAELEAKKKKLKKEPESLPPKPPVLKEASNSLFEEATPDDKAKPKGDSQTSFHGDSDSDWEDMEGEKPGLLSESGREMKTLLNKASSNRVAHDPKFERKDSKPVNKKPVAVKTVAKEPVAREPVARKVVEPVKSEPIADMKFAPSSSYSLQIKSGQSSSLSGVDDYYETEFFSNIRIKKPLVSSLTLKNMMNGRKFVSVSNIVKNQRMGQLEVDWVTIGVIVGKSEVKKSSKGNSFTSWRLSSMSSCEDPQLQCFLFGAAFKKHWKTPVGSVVGLLNPSPMPNKEGSKSDELSLMVDVDQKVLQLGHSKDFALCRSKTKAGRDCSNFVNRQKGEYCIYHVQHNYKKQSAKRPDIQSGYSGVTPKSFEKKVFKKSTMTINYAGQTFTSGPGTSNSSKKAAASIKLEDLQRQYQRTVDQRQGLSTLSLHDVEPVGKVIPEKKTSKTSEAFCERLIVPSPGSLQFVQHLKNKEKNESVEKIMQENPNKKFHYVSANEILKDHERTMKKKKSQRLAELPCLGRGLSGGDEVALDEPSNAVKTMDRARFEAIKRTKLKGGIEKPDPNAVKKRKSEAHREIPQSSHEALTEQKVEPPRKKSRSLSGINLDPAEMKRILKAKSAHDNTLSQEEADKMDDYFNALEKTEKMENAMSGVTQLKCKAVTCAQCKYTALGPSQRCKDEGHRLKYFNAVKRFFACHDCGNRTVTLERYPKETCRKCGGSSYKSTSMMKEKCGPKLSSEQLVLTAEESHNMLNTNK
ncbi:hypothetical protein CAPTEDRAFT_229132 [Capitella teleta]|uniref:Protein MCM10 homolog n=1 Tax=Capitella teleta TaxID=283909 RepID=R7VGN7_CAPTE|nr:hypothetical protein CAPTEDRAFT_229132 [Capitella teleta]|eukprot:ELU17712.1 hypothetical protein CAPTEDRAFT_229132 [Capitella teleta]